MSTALDNLTAEIAQDEQVMSSALKLIDSLAVKIAEAGTDPQKLQNLTVDLMNSREALAAAIATNTPADAETTTPVETPAEPPVEPPAPPVDGGNAQA